MRRIVSAQRPTTRGRGERAPQAPGGRPDRADSHSQGGQRKKVVSPSARRRAVKMSVLQLDLLKSHCRRRTFSTRDSRRSKNSASQVIGSKAPAMTRHRTTARRSRFESVLTMNAAKIRTVTDGIFDNVQDLERAVDEVTSRKTILCKTPAGPWAIQSWPRPHKKVHAPAGASKRRWSSGGNHLSLSVRKSPRFCVWRSANKLL